MEHIIHPGSLHVVYISSLAPSADYRTFAAVCRSARARNPALGVGGVLLFDGERFCQWLHGDPAVVEALMATITSDQRHVDLQLLHHAIGGAGEADGRWHCGFVLPDALDALERVGSERQDAMGLFMELLAGADLEPLGPPSRTPEAPTPSSCTIHIHHDPHVHPDDIHAQLSESVQQVQAGLDESYRDRLY